MIFFTKRKIDELNGKLSREELLRRSRILIIDDEKPDLIQDLKRAGFSVDYEADITQSNLDMIERPTYDLVILDFGSVGHFFGADEGLSLLRHLKRVNPAVIVFAYTSMALTQQHADFFRLADGVLAKDAGIGESMEKIEDGLKSARDIKNLWKGFLHAANIEPNSKEDVASQDLFIKGMEKPTKLRDFKLKFSGSVNNELANKATGVIIEKLIETGIHSLGG